MKLVTLTVYLWSGWPKGVVALEQTASGHLVGTYTTTRKREMRKDPLPLCEDWSASVVTEKDFDAELRRSLRAGASPVVDYFPLCRKVDLPDDITSSEHYQIAVEQFENVANKSTAALIAQIAALHLEMETVLGIHLTTLRQRRKLAVQVVPQDQTLAWQLGKNLPVWPILSWNGQPYAAKYVSQWHDGHLRAHMEYDGKLYVITVPVDYVPFPVAADALDRDGAEKLVTRAQWEAAQSARIEKSRAHTEKFKEEVLPTEDGKPRPGTPEYGAMVHQMALKSAPDLGTQQPEGLPDQSLIDQMIARAERNRQLAERVVKGLPVDSDPVWNKVEPEDPTDFDKYGE